MALSLMSAPLFLSPADNELVCALVIARLVAAGRLAPGCNRVASAGSLALTTAMWMVNRVHGHAAIHRLLAQPDIPSGFADGHVLVVHVADLSNGRHAIDQYFTGLARRQLDQRVFAFLRHQLRGTSG